MKGYDGLNPPQLIQSTLLLVFTLCIRSITSLAFLYLESSPLFASTSIRGVLGDLSMPRHPRISPLRWGPSWEARSRSVAKKTTLCAIVNHPSPRHRSYGRTQMRSRSCARSWTVLASTESTVMWFVLVFGG
jgi:hypothetical protein